VVQGLTATILRNTPANAVYLGNFELFKATYCEAYGVRPSEIPSSVVLACAGTGGITYWLACFPIDQVKSAMQTDSIISSERKYGTVMSTVGKLWSEGGVSRFFRGFAPCLIRAAPANGVMLLTVQRVTEWLSTV
jgi:solute carrier family 25 carnitine/acylcarnitine transporter 20/29